MTYLLRVLFFGVPAFIVLIGGYCVAPNDFFTEDDLQPGSSFETSIEWPSEKDEDLVHRVALKQECTLDLLDGRLTLDEAVERFRIISSMTGTNESDDSSRCLKQVISFVRAHAARNPVRFQASCSQIELSAHLRSPSLSISAANCELEKASPHNSATPYGF